jgi:hypothetical protein
MKPKLLYIFLILLVALSACINYGNHIQTSYGLARNQPIVSEYTDSVVVDSKLIPVFFTPKPLHSGLDFVEINSICVEGAEHTTDEEMMAKFKQEALILKAHAIIKAEASFKARSRGYYSFLDLKDYQDSVYQAKVYCGIAICFKTK